MIIFCICYREEDSLTNSVGRTIPNPIEAIVNKTPMAVIRATALGLNHVLANLEGEFMMKIFPREAKKDPIITGTRLVVMKTLSQTPTIRQTAPNEH